MPAKNPKIYSGPAPREEPTTAVNSFQVEKLRHSKEAGELIKAEETKKAAITKRKVQL